MAASTIMNGQLLCRRDGVVCAVAFSGAVADDQWPGSRLIAAEKANTANALSLKQMALSTANLYAGSQPGGPLFGLAGDQPGQLRRWLSPAIP